MENQSVYEKLIEALAGNPAIAFGHQVIAEMATENILLGITQAGFCGSTPMWRIVVPVGSTTTYYPKLRLSFSAGSATGQGNLFWRKL